MKHIRVCEEPIRELTSKAAHSACKTPFPATGRRWRPHGMGGKDRRRLCLAPAGCGAVKATIQGKEVPGQISALYPHIQPAVDRAGNNLEAATKANAKIQADLLRESSTVIKGMVKEGKLKVVAGYYDISTGGVTLLNQQRRCANARDSQLVTFR